MKELFKRIWPGAWPAAQLLAQLIDIEFLERLDLIKGFLGVLPHLIAVVGFVLFLIVPSLYLASYPASAARIDRLRKPLYAIVLIAFLVSLNLVLISLPDTAFWSDLTVVRLWLTVVAYLIWIWGLGALLASAALGAALRRPAP
ncbi:MAG TPA: hypothetical protein VLX85_11450 [Stellaceae bacterium]|nr:hypothetical protein [Stellaceae bacterium]